MSCVARRLLGRVAQTAIRKRGGGVSLAHAAPGPGLRLGVSSRRQRHRWQSTVAATAVGVGGGSAAAGDVAASTGRSSRSSRRAGQLLAWRHSYQQRGQPFAIFVPCNKRWACPSSLPAAGTQRSLQLPPFPPACLPACLRCCR